MLFKVPGATSSCTFPAMVTSPGLATSGANHVPRRQRLFGADRDFGSSPSSGVQGRKQRHPAAPIRTHGRSPSHSLEHAAPKRAGGRPSNEQRRSAAEHVSPAGQSASAEHGTSQRSSPGSNGRLGGEGARAAARCSSMKSRCISIRVAKPTWRHAGSPCVVTPASSVRSPSRARTGPPESPRHVMPAATTASKVVSPSALGAAKALGGGSFEAKHPVTISYRYSAQRIRVSWRLLTSSQS